jgi:uncharacterized membrane protein YeiH
VFGGPRSAAGVLPVVAWVAVGATVGGDCRVFCDLNHAIGLSVSAGGGVLCEVAVQSGAVVVRVEYVLCLVMCGGLYMVVVQSVGPAR